MSQIIIVENCEAKFSATPIKIHLDKQTGQLLLALTSTVMMQDLSDDFLEQDQFDLLSSLNYYLRNDGKLGDPK